MKLRFTTSIGGAFNFTEGAVIEPTTIDPHVQKWIEDGIVEVVREDDRETAVLGAPERAVSLRRRGRGVQKRSSALAR